MILVATNRHLNVKMEHLALNVFSILIVLEAMFVSTTLAKSVVLRIIPVVANQHLDAKMEHLALNVSMLETV